MLNSQPFENGKQRADRHANYGNSAIDANRCALFELIADLRQRHIDIVFVTLPHMDDYWTHQDRVQSAAVADLRNSLIVEFGFDASSDFWDLSRLVTSSATWFYDGDHVNTAGARVLSEHLSRLLDERLSAMITDDDTEVNRE